MQVQAVTIISLQLFFLAAGNIIIHVYSLEHTLFAATLTSTSVACPDDTVTFSCTLPGSILVWDITPPQGQGNVFRISLSASNTENTEGNPAFRGVLTDSSGGMVTATLTSLSVASIVEGYMVECAGESSREDPLTITVAGEFRVCSMTLRINKLINGPTDLPSPPLNTGVSSTLNQLSSSIITLEWDPPSSTGGVSVRYMSSPSPNTSLWLTSHRGDHLDTDHCLVLSCTIYSLLTVTIRADNCVGMSQESSIGDISIKRFLSRI